MSLWHRGAGRKKQEGEPNRSGRRNREKKGLVYQVLLQESAAQPWPGKARAWLDRDFLSVTIDTSVLVGGRWWGPTRGLVEGLSRDRVAALNLEHPEFIRRTRLLGAGMLRIGGTEADRIRYGFFKEERHLGLLASLGLGPQPLAGPGLPDQTDPGSITGGTRSHTRSDDPSTVLRKALWKRLCAFASSCGLELVFNIGMGPEHRDAKGHWLDRDARRIISWAGRKDSPVRAWELGNEVNAFPFIYGLGWRQSGKAYARDFALFSRLVAQLDPGALKAGPASAVWPRLGEMNALIPGFLSCSEARDLDVLSVHWYPQQSFRGRFAVRRARGNSLLSNRVLDEPRRWIRRFRRLANARGVANKAAYAGQDQSPRTVGTPRLWVTEVGHALYGGQPGLSDTWNSSLWWLDFLCLAASEGVGAVFRQSLVGSDYGLLDPVDFKPRPDWWVACLFTRLLGREVFGQVECQGPDKRLRVWAFAGKRPKEVWLVCINLHRRRQARLDLVTPAKSGLLNPAGVQAREVWVLSGLDGPRSGKVALNGVELDDGFLEDWNSQKQRERFHLAPGQAELMLPPLSCGFVALGVAGASAPSR